MSTKVQQFNTAQLKTLPNVRPGDIVKIHQKIKEGDKDRIQIFEGVVIARKHGKGISSAITVRKVVEGIGVERIFPVHAFFIDKIEVISSGKTRRSKLYYLRTAKGVKSRLKKKIFSVAVSADVPVVSEIKEKPENEEVPQ